MIITSSFLTGFLSGFLACAAVQYGLQQFIDRNKAVAKHNDKINEWNLLFETHNQLLTQMKHDLNDPIHANVREFFVVDKTAIMSSSIPRLRYDLSEDTILALNKLAELGYIQRLPNDSLLYRMEDEFISQLKCDSL